MEPRKPESSSSRHEATMHSESGVERTDSGDAPPPRQAGRFVRQGKSPMGSMPLRSVRMRLRK